MTASPLFIRTCLPLLAAASLGTLALYSHAEPMPTVGKPLQRGVELTCRLDIFTPMLYDGIITEVGGNRTSLTFSKSCAELQGQEHSIKEGKAALHAKSLLTWEVGMFGAKVQVGDQMLDIPKKALRKSIRVVPLGRMSLVDFGSEAHIYDNQEQHWCPFALKFPAIKEQSPALYWYDKKSQNIVRFYQGEWAKEISKTQHYLPAVCSNSQTPMPPRPVQFKYGKDIPVNVHKGPIVVNY